MSSGLALAAGAHRPAVVALAAAMLLLVTASTPVRAADDDAKKATSSSKPPADPWKPMRLGPDEFVERFEIAEPGNEFALYSETVLRRVK